MMKGHDDSSAKNDRFKVDQVTRVNRYEVLVECADIKAIETVNSEQKLD